MIEDIVLAGLLHDVGKFAERGDPEKYDNLGQEAEFTYNHAAATFKFLQSHVSFQGGQPKWFNYAAMHHKPSDNETKEWIIAEADRLSSGMDRQTYAADERSVGKQKFSTPLKPVTEFVALKQSQPKVGAYYLPLKTFSPEEKNIFPRPFTADLDLRRSYSDLFRQFSAEFDQMVAHGIEKKLDTLYFILQKYWWAVPASVRKSDFPDVSLFEHAKTTAALAAALFVYHEQTKTLQDLSHIKNRKIDKFILFVGDVGGIQKFIYQVSSKGAYSQLKGRSFYIQIINDLIAEYLVEQVGLTRPNIIYSNGGKFYLLLPNTPFVKNSIAQAVQSVNQSFFDEFDGQVFLRTAMVPFSGDDLHISTKRLPEIWRQVNVLLAEQSLRPFDFMVAQTKFYDKLFAPQGKGQTRLCASCHRELEEDSTSSLCRVCRHMQEIGDRLKSAKFMVVAHKKRNLDSAIGIFLDKKIFLYDAPEEIQLNRLQEGDHIYLFNRSDWQPFTQSDWFKTYRAQEMLGAQSQPVIQWGFKFYGGTRRLNVTFDALARRARGNFKKLAVLRMDVDNLGSLFSKGLLFYRVKPRENDPNEEEPSFYSISRMTTLSSQLNVFFSGYLNQLLEPTETELHERAAIVYAGGDDLFIIGSWDATLEMAVTIRKKFSLFTCHNPAFTISGGMVITDGKFPIYKSAQYAGAAEEAAKNHKSETRKKDSFTLFGVSLFWDEVYELQEHKEALLAIIESDGKNRSFLQHLRRIANEYLTLRSYYARKDYREKEILRFIRHERWLWRMVYDLHRYRSRNKHLYDLVERYEQKLAQTNLQNEKPFIENLPVLVQWVDFLTRKEKKEAL